MNNMDIDLSEQTNDDEAIAADALVDLFFDQPNPPASRRTQCRQVPSSISGNVRSHNEYFYRSGDRLDENSCENSQPNPPAPNPTAPNPTAPNPTASRRTQFRQVPSSISGNVRSQDEYSCRSDTLDENSCENCQRRNLEFIQNIRRGDIIERQIFRVVNACRNPNDDRFHESLTLCQECCTYLTSTNVNATNYEFMWPSFIWKVRH